MKYPVQTLSAPPPKTILRRYLDLSKYLDLLCSKEIYFGRADKCSDQLEGSLPYSMREAQDFLKGEGYTQDDANDFIQRARIGTYISCWTIGQHDNMALWQLYGGLKNSVAITTTVEKLESTLSSHPDWIEISKIKYIDHHKDPACSISVPTSALMYKNKSYFFEREVRVLIDKTRTNESIEKLADNPESIRLKVDINTLIRSVVLSPESEPWFEKLIREVSKKFEMTQPIRNSILSKPISK